MGGIVDFIFGYDEPEPSVVNVSVPEKTDTEKELIALQTEILRNQAAGPTPEQQALNDKTMQYYNEMIADTTLSPEEEAEFDKEYNLQTEALDLQFGEETSRYGSTQMADLVSRGMLETTTGEREIAQTQERFAEILGSTKSGMLEAKEIAKSDMEGAKRSLATAGYSLTSGMSQSQMQTALEASMGMQNYFLNQGGMQASAALQNALSTQVREQAAYKQRMSMWSSISGLGLGIAKGGLM